MVVLVFSLWVHGQLHTNHLHGYDSINSCVAAAKDFDRAFDLVHYNCELETTKGIK